MLMTYDELDSMMKHYLTPTAYTNMCEILDNIRAKVSSNVRKDRCNFQCNREVLEKLRVNQRETTVDELYPMIS